ncbi:MAG: hypothetical protein MUE53_03615 [Chitinophagales bacterium]|nr:hypothetical protein [Chitinophagales bacterium]
MNKHNLSQIPMTNKSYQEFKDIFKHVFREHLSQKTQVTHLEKDFFRNDAFLCKKVKQMTFDF